MNHNSSQLNSYRYRQVKQVTIVSSSTNLFLSITKMLGGWYGQSQALFADGVHSLSDLITDILVLFAAKYGGQAADESHPYGHARIETAATLALAVLLIVVGVGIAYDVVSKAIAGYQAFPHAYVLWFAAFSVVANEMLYRYTLKVGKRIKSDLLIANALHSRSDAASSIIVLIGVGGSLLGVPYLDALAAVIVSIFICKMGWSIAWSNLTELVDTALNKEQLDEIEDLIFTVPGVQSLHELRSRRMGGRALLDLHLIVNPLISVSEGHHIGERVMHTLLTKLDYVNDVIVHIDYEHDEPFSKSLHLPLRQDLLPQLKAFWEHLPGYDQIQGIHLHYLSGKLQIEIVLPFALSHEFLETKQLQHQYFEAAKQVNSEIIEVKILFQGPLVS